MNCSFPNIEKEMKLRNLTYGELAKVVGLTELQMYRRLSGAVQWKLEEAYQLCKFLNRFDIQTLFEKNIQTVINVEATAKSIITGEENHV